MDFLPIFVQLRDKHCLVVGGGDVALRKIQTLLQAGARVRVVSRTLHSGIEALADEHDIDLVCSHYRDEHMDSVELAIAATDDRRLNQRISAAAKARKILVNVVDDPELCTFIFPAIIDRSPITIAIGTGGNAPVLARLLRARIESLIPFQYGALAQLASRYRDRVKAMLPTETARKLFWERVFEGAIGEKVLAGKRDAAERELAQLIDSHAGTPASPGEVYLVGAGPGDPELLTFKALRLMQRADVVIHDRLVSREILSLVRRDARRIYVGKESNNHCVPQQQINDLLIELAGEGKRVLRLKGGDPFIFGRGGEEAEALVSAGIGFQVVPGITSAAGAATYCGIPLTHRDYAHSVTFTTGHLKNGNINIDWHTVSRGQHTLVVYMGLNNLSVIAGQLMRHGLSAQTPVAIVRHATRPDQSLLTGNLQTISDQVIEAGIESPVVIIIGEVVRLHETLGEQILIEKSATLKDRVA